MGSRYFNYMKIKYKLRKNILAMCSTSPENNIFKELTGKIEIDKRVPSFPRGWF